MLCKKLNSNFRYVFTRRAMVNYKTDAYPEGRSLTPNLTTSAERVRNFELKVNPSSKKQAREAYLINNTLICNGKMETT